MMELVSIVNKYQKLGQMYQFIQDYISIRDICLQGREITSENLDEIMPRIKADLALRLIQLKTRAQNN